MGCNGGLYDYAFDYAYYNALETESDYPYRGVDGYCQYSSSRGKVNANTYSKVRRGSVSSMKGALKQGPVSISVQANQNSFMYYNGGILEYSSCRGARLDHAILAVGVGNDGGDEYLIVKNSWGPSWGENGYIRLSITGGYGACGCLDDDTIPYTN